MPKSTYSIRPANLDLARHGLARPFKVYRHTVHYPRGMYVMKVTTREIAESWIALQSAEDAANRLERVRDYLEERALRPAPVAEVNPAQMSLFA